MGMSEILGAIKESIILAERVDNLGDEVINLNKNIRDIAVNMNSDIKENRDKIYMLNEKVIRIESLIEFTQKNMTVSSKKTKKHRLK